MLALIVAGIEELGREPVFVGTSPGGAPFVALPYSAEPLDRSTLDYVGNLRERIDAGDWTLGEGLVDTLAMFAGEKNTADVLVHPDLEEFEGSAIISMAQRYLLEGDDDSSKAEIERLLARLSFTEDQLAAMAADDSEDPDATDDTGEADDTGDGDDSAAHRSAAAGLIANQQFPSEDCARFFENTPVPAEGIGQCLESTTFQVSGNTYTIYRPVPGLYQGGWNVGHLTWTEEAIRKAVPVLKQHGQITGGVVVLSVSNTGTHSAETWLHDIVPGSADGELEAVDTCRIVLRPNMQKWKGDQFRQAVAHELSHCFEAQTFRAQDPIGNDVDLWWVEGFAEYMSNVVYPHADLEHRGNDKLKAVELTTTIFDRSYRNAIFFQFIANESGGTAGVLSLIRSLPSNSSGAAGQESGLARSVSSALYQEFVEAMTDGTIADTGNATYPKFESARGPATTNAEGPGLIQAPVKPFGVDRVRIIVPPEKSAALTLDGEGDHEHAMRAAPAPGSWEALVGQPLEATCEEESEWVLVVGATGDDVTYEVDVADLVDLDECEEDEPEFITDIDACLVGEWRLDMENYLRGRVADDPILLGSAKNHRVNGTVTMKLEASGDVTININGYEESHDIEYFSGGNTFTQTLSSRGAAAGAWGANGSLWNARWGSISFETVIENDIGTARSPGPPIQILFAGPESYRCSESTLVNEHPPRPPVPGGSATTWHRVN